MKKGFLLCAGLCVALFLASCGSGRSGAEASATAETTAETTAQTQTHTDMKYQSPAFLYESELPWQTPVEGLRRQIMGYNDQMMLVKIEFEAGCDGGGRHAHPHTQSSMVVSGVFEVTIDGVTQTLRAGDGFCVAPNRMHGAVCIEAGTLIDAFSPLREDFLK
jgi:quercetin dioxygenase-like cupin family protein